MAKTEIRSLCFSSLFIALVTMGTVVFQIPIVATKGYIHLGDGIIFLIAILFGKKYGMLAGGIGSFLADVLTGYTQWAIFSLLIKGAMGWMVGQLGNQENENRIWSVRKFFALLIGSLIMVVGYLMAGWILNGSFLVSLTSVPSNCIQAVGGAVVYAIVGSALQRINIRKWVI